jgi:hypothetical protein
MARACRVSWRTAFWPCWTHHSAVRRGTVWAIEEPESFLHASLQAALARRLGEYAHGERLQILLTTHSPAFLGVADEGFTVSINDSGRTGISKEPRQLLIREAQRSGVTPFAHPLHTGPPKPLLLVEGKNDRELLVRAYLASTDPCPYEVMSMEDLEPTLQGGVDQIRSYLHHNRSAVRARPNASPILVVLDWEVSPAKEAAINTVLAEHPTSTCVRMPESARNQDLSGDFVGIEGFLSTKFYEDAVSAIGLALTKPVQGASAGYKYAIKRADLASKKDAIHKLLGDRNEPADLAPIVATLPWLNSYVAAGKQLTAVP